MSLAVLPCHAQSAPAGQRPEQEIQRELDKYPGLLPEFGQLFAKMKDNVSSPAARTESRLLPLLPASTTFFVALPNYGETAHQALDVFRKELKESQVLRDWWNSKDMAAAAPKIEDSIDKFYQVHQFLGDEILILGTMEGKKTNVLAMAEIRKPGLQKLLEQIVEQLGGVTKAGVRILDPPALTATKGQGLPSELKLLVRPDYVLASEDQELLRRFSAQLDRKSGEFVSTPFGQRVTREYRGGLTLLAAADLQKILDESSPSTKQDPAFRQSGFDNVQYAVWDHKGEGDQAINQAELSFTGPRHGPAAWLAKSGPLPSLDFVSPEALLAGAIVLSNPAQIFDDVKQIAGPSSQQFAAIAGGEKALNLSLKDDLLGTLGGEITVELDKLTPPQPVWKAMLSVRDAEHLQRTLAALLAVANFKVEQTAEGGITYQTFRIPNNPAPVEISYAFADGYLIAGSGRGAVAESIRLHRSGASLAKSAKFQSARPPGHSREASALLYNDPVAMAAIQMQRISPEMARSLLQSSLESTPSVSCLYGEESAIKQAGRSGSFDIGTILVVAAIAIPNLLRSRMAANEASAVGSVRTLNTAQMAYSFAYPQRGFAPNLATLGPDPSATQGKSMESPQHANLIDASLASENCTPDGWCIKSGYRFRLTTTCAQRLCKEYVVVAAPVNPNTGTRSFCSTSDGIIRLQAGSPLTAPLTVSGCRSWPAIQ
jgi:type II secretory pathway pseudopilin PulG